MLVFQLAFAADDQTALRDVAERQGQTECGLDSCFTGSLVCGEKRAAQVLPALRQVATVQRVEKQARFSFGRGSSVSCECFRVSMWHTALVLFLFVLAGVLPLLAGGEALAAARAVLDFSGKNIEVYARRNEELVTVPHRLLGGLPHADLLELCGVPSQGEGQAGGFHPHGVTGETRQTHDTLTPFSALASSGDPSAGVARDPGDSNACAKGSWSAAAHTSTFPAQTHYFSSTPAPPLNTSNVAVGPGNSTPYAKATTGSALAYHLQPPHTHFLYKQ